MRGKAKLVVFSINVLGITPAYAGKSYANTFHNLRRQDHPRLCGEKRFAPAFSSLVMGSPPPMRGKGTATGFGASLMRITPAYAGKSGVFSLLDFVEKDHPRLCGEKPSGLFTVS